MKKLSFLERFLLILVISIWNTNSNAQSQIRKPLIISLYSMATQLPGGNITPIHPGIEIGTEFRYNSSETNQWLQTVKAGVYLHQYSQTGIQLYTETGYRRPVYKKLAGEFRLGAGYQLAYPDLQIFSFNDGDYVEKKFRGRSQLIVSGAIGFSYRLSNISDGPRIFTTLQCFFQMPFIKSYVPVLPNTALHLGLAVPFFKSSK